MSRVSYTEARGTLADILNRVAYADERVLIHRRGKNVAAIIPVEDLALLEEIEDRIDLTEARRRLADPNEEFLDYDLARKELGL